jgi:hypothetical protein
MDWTQNAALHSEHSLLLQAMHQVSSQDMTYLRHVLVDGFATGLLPKDSKIFHVVSSVLKFTPQEMDSIKASKAAATMSGLLAGLWGGGAGGSGTPLSPGAGGSTPPPPFRR